MNQPPTWDNGQTVANMHLTKQELVWLADHFREKAMTEHFKTRHWQNRALLAESRLSILEAQRKQP